MKTISFDLDGTLSDLKNFEELFWYGEIPRLYSEKHNMSFEEARILVKKAYDEMGDQRIEWYTADYWIKSFELEKSFDEIMPNIKDKLTIYPEVKGVLNHLSRNYEIIILTKSPLDMAVYKLRVGNIIKKIKHVFSTISYFNSVEKSKEIFENILEKLNLSKDEIVHVGVSFNSDYITPKSFGIRSFYLDRANKMNGREVIHSLSELEGKLNGF